MFTKNWLSMGSDWISNVPRFGLRGTGAETERYQAGDETVWVSKDEVKTWDL